MTNKENVLSFLNFQKKKSKRIIDSAQELQSQSDSQRYHLAVLNLNELLEVISQINILLLQDH